MSRFAVRSAKGQLRVITSIANKGIILRVSHHHLDTLLKIIAAVLSGIEEQDSTAGFDIRVRDINNSEPPACSAQFNNPFEPVPDIGCGSSILSIVACQLGAAQSTGVEIDPGAVQAARQNILANSLAGTSDIQETSRQTIEGQYDLVLANPVPSVLCKAAGRIPSLLNKNGHAIVAGFRTGQTENFRKIFQENNLRLVGDYALHDWDALLLSNKDCNTRVRPLFP